MEQKNKNSLGTKVRSFDIFEKLPDDMTQGSNYGRIISLFLIMVIGYLVFKEYNIFYRSNLMISTEMAMDDSGYKNQKIQLNFDITFGRTPCGLLNLDSSDEIGTFQFNLGNINKQNIDKDSNPLGPPIKQNPNQVGVDKNTQKQTQKAIKNSEGCRIYGDMSINRVPGQFHILAFNQKSDLSHKVNHFYFTEPQYHYDKNVQINKEQKQLAEQYKLDFENDALQGLNSPHVNYQASHVYYLQIVPTKFVYHESIVSTDETIYQYVANRNTINSRFMPGLYIKYEISSIAMKYKFVNQEYSHFLIEVFAIIGGVFTLAGLLNTFLMAFVKPNRQPYNIPI